MADIVTLSPCVALEEVSIRSKCHSFQARDRRLGQHDHRCRDLLHEGLERRLVLEGSSQLATLESVEDPRENAAPEIHAPSRPEDESEVAREPAEQRDEQADGLGGRSPSHRIGCLDHLSR